jgi:hypothetical protein
MTVWRWVYYIYVALLMLDFIVGTIIGVIWRATNSNKLQKIGGICVAIFVFGCALMIVPFFIWIFTK